LVITKYKFTCKSECLQIRQLALVSGRLVEIAPMQAYKKEQDVQPPWRAHRSNSALGEQCQQNFPRRLSTG
jgi:hypothetical protein